MGAFVVGLGLVAFVHVLDYQASEELIRSFHKVEAMQKTLLRLVDVQSRMKDIQRSHRGYVITANEEFLEPYKQAKENLPALLLSLEQDLEGHSHQHQDFYRMQQLIAAKLEYADSAILRVAQGEREVAVQEITRGKQIFDQLIQVQARLIDREQELLALVRQEAEANSQKNRMVVLAAFFVSVALMLLALWRIALNVKAITNLQLRLQEANEELSAFNEELLTTNQMLVEHDDKLFALNQELELSNNVLEKMSAELSTFSYSISHDLRAPLRAISGYSSILKEEFGEQLGEEGNKLVEIVRINANRMGTLIHDLLNFAKLGKKAVHKRSCDMEVLVRQVLAEASVKEGTKISIASMEPAMIDPTLFRQVWENLISNALKFSRQQAAPEIMITYSRESTKQVFCVQDNGVGFDPAYAQDLFQVFKRLHADVDFEGTGAGLAIARRIVEGHGGEIWADAVPGKGATFCFSLPVED